MASTYSPNLRIELIGTGEQAGTWGTTTNTNLGTLLEGAISGYVAVPISALNQALTTSNGGVDQARLAILRLDASGIGGSFNLYAPPAPKIYIIANNTNYNATIYNSAVIGGTTSAPGALGVTIPPGVVVQVWSDGTNFSSTDLVDPILANSAVVSSASTGTALTVTQTGTGNAFVVQDESPDNTPFVIDNSGRVISGYTTYRAFNYAATPRFQINGTDATSGAITSVISSATAAESGSILLGRSRGSQASPSGLSSGDDVGRVQFEGYAGSAMLPAAAIIAQADGGVGATDMPGRLTFWTTLDGTATLTERMRIDNAGRIGIGAAPISSTAVTISSNVTGATTAWSLYNNSVIQNDVTATGLYYGTVAATGPKGSAYTITNIHHFSATQGTLHADSTVTNQVGFVAGGTMSGGVNNYGFLSNLNVGTEATISTESVSGNVVTITTTANHGFKVNQLVEINIPNQPQLNGIFTITSASLNTFQYARTTADMSAADTGTAAILSNMSFVSSTAPSRFSGRLIVDASSTVAALRITQRGTGNSIIVEDSTNPDSTPFVVDTDGCVVLGSQTRYGTYSGSTPWLQLISPFTGQSSILMQGTASGSGTAPILNIANASSTNAGVVASGNTLGAIRFYGGDGAGPIQAAQIECRVDGTPGLNDMPGRIAFLTTPSGSSSPLERMRIDNLGRIGIGGAASANSAFNISNDITNSVTGSAYSLLIDSPTKPDVTAAVYVRTSASTSSNAGTPYTVTSMYHYLCNQSTLHADSTVTYQYGFAANTSLTGAANNYSFYAANSGGASATTGKANYGFRSDLDTATGGGTAWNFYANGTAANYFKGAVQVVGSLGYTTGAGGTVTQATSRTTGVTLNKVTGAITLVSAAGSTAWQSFTVTNSTVAATDTVIVNQKSGADIYMIHVTAVAAGSFRITFATTGGTTTEQPVINFAVIKGVTS